MMKAIAKLFFLAAICLPMVAAANDGYKVSGHSGIMYFVAIDDDKKDDEDVYRFAVVDICDAKAACQIQYWVGDAPSGFPLTQEQIDSKLVHWQQDSELNQWIVNCKASDLFSKERQCMKD